MANFHPACFWHRVFDKTGDCEAWLCDPTVKLTYGCRVVVHCQGVTMLVGTIANKRPVDFRRTVIDYRDVDGNRCRSWGHGRKDAETQIARVIAILKPMPGCSLNAIEQS